MKRLVFWYGVKEEDRGQAYSFVNASQIVSYEEGVKGGYTEVPMNIKIKLEQNKMLNKKEDMLQRGLCEIDADMQLDKSERIERMMQHNEEHETEHVVASASVETKSTLKAKAIDKQKLQGESKSGMGMKSKRKSASVPDEPVSSTNGAIPDEVASSSARVRGSVISSKRTRYATPSPVLSTFTTSQVQVKAEPAVSSSVEKGKGDKYRTSTSQKPSPEECRLVVQELGKLHPNVIEENNQRREMWAMRDKKVKEEPCKSQTCKSSPITDAIISTMLSQNTTAANQNRAFSALKKAYPSWEQVANETNVTRIEDAIRVAGLAQVRAERMQGMLRTIQKERGEANFEFLQHVHSNDDIIKELSRHKGMGPKTISCVLLFALGRPDFPVDTHVLRISKQMGWVGQSLSREAAYVYMNDRVPDDCKLDLHCLLVTHGKQCNKCAARGRAQFPPKLQWVCPMAAIKNGKLSFLDEKQSASVKEDSELGSNHLFDAEDSSIADTRATAMKAEEVTSSDATVKLEQMERDGRLFRC